MGILMNIEHSTFRSINLRLQDSDLFKNAKDHERKPNALSSIIIFFCLWGGSLVLGRFIILPIIDLLPNDTPFLIPFALSLRKILICGFQILAFFAWVRFVEKRRIATLGFICKHKAKAYWGGFLFGLGSIFAITLVLVVIGAIAIDYNNLFTTDILLSSLCIAVFGWGIQSASEEIAIRGWLIPTLGVRYNPLAAVLLTGGVFGILHLLGNGATILSFINLTLSGFFFAMYAISAGNIWGVCGLHLSWNLAQGNIFGLNISGEPSANNSLFITNNTGADLLTGGDFGPEGGIITTCFLACAIMLMSLNMYRKHKNFINMHCQ